MGSFVAAVFVVFSSCFVSITLNGATAPPAARAVVMSVFVRFSMMVMTGSASSSWPANGLQVRPASGLPLVVDIQRRTVAGCRSRSPSLRIAKHSMFRTSQSRPFSSWHSTLLRHAHIVQPRQPLSALPAYLNPASLAISVTSIHEDTVLNCLRSGVRVDDFYGADVLDGLHILLDSSIDLSSGDRSAISCQSTLAQSRTQKVGIDVRLIFQRRTVFKLEGFPQPFRQV